ncbi:hypothetical protein FACS1894159_07650 [Bacteroidia bacterium]|nr:hypothetical protein FACS1894159_07650 [Bacteroidia bacterium]
MITTDYKSIPIMPLEDFINEHLCPAGVVTRWDAEQIALAVRLGDKARLRAVLERLCIAAGVTLPQKVEELNVKPND